MTRQRVTRGSSDAIRAAHHQIGNSLQSVASLLSLQSRTAPPDAAIILTEAQRRVQTVMRLHQRLQETGGDFVRLDDLIGDICRDVAALDAIDREAEIRLDLHALCADTGTASALGMITAEWLGNALEHGLADRGGVVRVRLEPAGDGARLMVLDTGVGSRRGSWTRGFGLALVSRLALQLGGVITEKVDHNGSRFVLECPEVWRDPDLG